jgi:hypothetical protein
MDSVVSPAIASESVPSACLAVMEIGGTGLGSKPTAGATGKYLADAQNHTT